MEADLQELAQPNTGHEGRDELEGKGEILPNLEDIYMPIAGMLFIKNAIHELPAKMEA